MFAFSKKFDLCMKKIFFSKFTEESGGKTLRTAFFLKSVLGDLNQAENENLTPFKQEGGKIYQQILCFVIVKQSFVSSLGHKNPRMSK